MNGKDKIANIKSWINKNGYPLEMQVAKKFGEAGFEISQSILYKDSETDKYREIDLIAHTSEIFNGVWINISFIVECKKSLNKPWIIFSNKDLYTIQNSKYPILASINGHRLIEQINKVSKFRSPLVFPNISNAGYNVVAAFAEKGDMPYSASQSVIKACEYLVRQSNNSNKKFVNIYIPIIAVEGELYEASLSVNNEISLVQVTSSTIISTKSFEEHNSKYNNYIIFR